MENVKQNIQIHFRTNTETKEKLEKISKKNGTNSLSNQLSVAKSSYPAIYDELDSLTVKNFENRIASSENLVVYVGRPTCGNCNQFETHLIKMIRSKKLSEPVKYIMLHN